MRKLLIPWMALALLPAAMPARANVLSYYCTGTSQGANGENMFASLVLSPEGGRRGISVNWQPAQRDVGPVPSRVSPDLSLTISFLEVGENGLSGQPGGGIVMLQVMSPPDNRQNPNKMRNQVRQYQLEVSFDGGPAIAVPLPDNDSFEDLPLTASRIGTIQIPSSAKRLQFSILDSKRNLVRTVEFDVSQVQIRDQLYRSALSEAQKMSADLNSCQKMG